MEQKQFVLNVLSLIPDQQLSPIQAQKLFFLIEKKLSSHCGADNVKVFDFKPYYYGPYDSKLTQILKSCVVTEELSSVRSGRVEYIYIDSFHKLNIDNFLDQKARNFIVKLANFVRKLSFRDLCMAIYKEFPEMAEKSVLIGNKS